MLRPARGLVIPLSPAGHLRAHNSGFSRRPARGIDDLRARTAFTYGKLAAPVKAAVCLARLPKEWTMPGQEHPEARARVTRSRSCLTDPRAAGPAGTTTSVSGRGPEGTGPRSLARWRQDEPARRGRPDRHCSPRSPSPWPAGRPGRRQHQPVHPGRPAFRHAGPAAARHTGRADLRLRRAVLLPAGAQSAQLSPHRVRHHHGPALPVHADRLSRAHLAASPSASMPWSRSCWSPSTSPPSAPWVTWARVFAADGGRHALAGLLMPGYFGLITSLSRDTAEPLAAVLPAGRAARGPRAAARSWPPCSWPTAR